VIISPLSGALTNKPIKRNWDNINYPQFLYVELWLIVEITGIFSKKSLTRVLRDSICDLVYNIKRLICLEHKM